MTLVYILCPPDVYEAAVQGGTYEPESLQTEGFIHASPVQQLSRVANKYYRQHANLCVLTVDPALVKAAIQWETITNGDQYPHIYGPLNMDAVIAVNRTARLPDGSYNILMSG